MFPMSRTSSLALLLAVAGAHASERADLLYIGTLHDATTTEVVLMMGTEQVPFEVTDQTAVTINGEASGIGDLKSGDRVSVLTVPGEFRMRVASQIAARRGPAGSQDGSTETAAARRG